MTLDTNEILYKITKSLSLSIDNVLEVYKLEDFNMDKTHLINILSKRLDKNFEKASFEELGVFLDGFISFKRGKSENKNKNEVELTNNLILKKLRIALELKEPEIEIIFSLADIELSKQQLSSLFRKEGHKNFKLCSDELLISFINGLDEFYFVGDEVE